MKSGKQKVRRSDRRGFLKLAGASAVAGGAATLGSAGKAEAAVESEPGRGYRETDHVRKFYRTARF
jgi:hypothetical protein